VLSIDILGDAPLVNGVTINLDQSGIANWNEIDAVELVGQAQPGVEISMWAEYAEATSQYSPTSWSAAQAAGAPDTFDCGDLGTAWASHDSTGRDNLRVYFPHLVIPTRLTIYQTYNPGAITQVDLILLDGSLLPVTDSADPGGVPCPGSMILDIETESMAIGAVIYLDQTITGNWNEIDAVQMTGRLAFDGLVRQWASDASASSQYGDNAYSALQATGGPNTRGCMDSGNAWASATVSGKDSLTVRFDEAVIPISVQIYQTYNPGAITGIDLITAGGEMINVTNSGDPGNLGCPAVLIIDILGDAPPTSGVIIYLDQSTINNWNEIDAVRLIGRRASSK
jgi:hypothetical protein